MNSLALRLDDLADVPRVPPKNFGYRLSGSAHCDKFNDLCDRCLLGASDSFIVALSSERPRLDRPIQRDLRANGIRRCRFDARLALPRAPEGRNS
ncbi:hypothetical protein [Kribbella sp. NBC_00359]|uniref:hypothetical protein n=1 Tax=Kribbella sp. NBC_00359 TaxID=2975966 RepID=UPI002E1B7B70